LKSKQQQAMLGFDAEVGAHIPQNTTYDVYIAAGPYYFHSSNATAWGGRARILGRYKEYVSLEVAYSYDHLFRSVVQGSIAFTLPFGRKLQRCGKCCPQTDNLLLSRAAFAPSRFEIPVVKKVHKHEKAIDPATGLPWTVWFVNNTSHSAGTFESPFPTLLQAQNASSPNDMIYVFPGDGTTTGMNAGIILKDGQTFFGSGIKQQFATTKGTVTIPAMSSGNPTITNAGVSVVTLGNGNVVSGFNVSLSAANAFGISTPIAITKTGATIANNVITVTGANSFGVFIAGSGAVNVYNNQIIGNFTSAGILLIAVDGTMSGAISNNSISGVNTGIGLVVPAIHPGSFDFTIQGNTVTGYGGAASTGIGVDMIGTSTVNIMRNTVTTNVNLAGPAIVVLDDPSTVSGRLVIEDNQVVIGAPSTSVGIQFFANNQVGWHLTSDVTNNSVQGVSSTFTGYSFSIDNTNTMCLTLDNNISVNSAAGSTAFNFAATGSGVLNIDSIEGDIGGHVTSTGNVFFVAPGTCGN
jgi:hypothetical protein